MAYSHDEWVNNSRPYINADNLNAMSETLEKVPIENGGTNATTAAQARTNLGITPANIGALPATGGTISGNLTVTGTLNANASGISGTLPITQGGTGVTTYNALRAALGLGESTTGVVPVLSGGTGVTSYASLRNALGLGETTGALPVAQGGTNATTASQARSNLGITPANIGALPTSGGTINGDLTFSSGKLVLDSDQYGTELPEAGTAGRIFFLKL